MTTENKRIVLAQRPRGSIGPEDLMMETKPVSAVLPEDFVRVANRYISLDPATRGWMDDKDSYMDPIGLGDVVRSGAVGEVLQSNSQDYEIGDIVVGLCGWEQVSDIHAARIGRTVSPDISHPLSYELSALGGNGLTAYFGLYDIGLPEAGDTVVVSAAAGGVGSIVGQLGKAAGCEVVGVVGSDEKCRFIIEELGYDSAINRKKGSLGKQLSQTCPQGVDIYFDNVGGEVLNQVLRHIVTGARIVLCGAISQINEPQLPPGPSNYIQLIARRARMQGFVTMDYAQQWAEASKELSDMVERGELTVVEEIIEGVEQIPNAFHRLFTGDKLGKLTIKV